MKQTKFRAFVNGELLPVLYIDFVNNEFSVLPNEDLEGNSQVYVKGLEKLEQFTGLHDKNGLEIYEGDICSRKVERSNEYPEQITMSGRVIPAEQETKRWAETQIGKITMNPAVRFDGHHIIKTWRTDELRELQVVGAWDYEIIGNIHENPDLIS